MAIVATGPDARQNPDQGPEQDADEAIEQDSARLTAVASPSARLPRRSHMSWCAPRQLAMNQGQTGMVWFEAPDEQAYERQREHNRIDKGLAEPELVTGPGGHHDDDDAVSTRPSGLSRNANAATDNSMRTSSHPSMRATMFASAGRQRLEQDHEADDSQEAPKCGREIARSHARCRAQGEAWDKATVPAPNPMNTQPVQKSWLLLMPRAIAFSPTSAVAL